MRRREMLEGAVGCCRRDVYNCERFTRILNVVVVGILG